MGTVPEPIDRTAGAFGADQVIAAVNQKQAE